MLNKIIKRGHKKVPKSDASDFGVVQSGNRSSGSVSTSNVVVNHASRVTGVVTGAVAGGGAGMLNNSTVQTVPSPGAIEALPMLKDVAMPERHSLLLRKLQVEEGFFADEKNKEKADGKIIHRVGGVVYLFRGRNYDQRTRSKFPLMLWKPATAVYPKLIDEAREGLTKEEDDELRIKVFAARMTKSVSLFFFIFPLLLSGSCCWRLLSKPKVLTF